MRQSNKSIGVLGGMGPEASSTLYRNIIEYTQSEYGAVQDTDYPPVFIYSLPLAGFDETGIRNERKVLKQLVDGVKILENAGSNLIIIACNTVHHFYDQMQNEIDIPILNIIEETARHIQVDGIKKVGLFASESTCKLGLYQKKLTPLGVEVIPPNPHQQKLLNNVIEHVMGGKQSSLDVEVLQRIADDFKSKGAEAVVLGCTEIPLVIRQSDTGIKLFDTIEIIAQSAVDYSLKG
jgi:aspartate racemase